MLIVLTGLPGAGCKHVARKLEKKGFARLVSHTCRPRRDNEKDGEDYHFVTEEEFNNLPLYESNGVYGLHVEELKKLAGNCVIAVTPDRANSYKNSNLPCVVVWLDAPIGVREYRLIYDLGIPRETARMLARKAPSWYAPDAVVESSSLKVANKVLEAVGKNKFDDIPIEGVYAEEDREQIIRETLEVARQKKNKVRKVVVEPEGDEYVLHIAFDSRIIRTRRITGYLASPDRFNAAKKAELRNRRPQMVV